MVSFFAVGVFMGISATAKAKGTVEAVEAAGAGDAGGVVWILGVAEVEQTGKADVVLGAVEEVEAIEDRGAGEAIEVGDAVEAGDIARAGDIVKSGMAGATKSNILKASIAMIFAAIKLLCLPYMNIRSSSRLGPSLEIAFLQHRSGSAHSNISFLSYSTIMPRLVTTLLMWS